MVTPHFDAKEAALSKWTVGARAGWVDKKVGEWEEARQEACERGQAAHVEAERVALAPHTGVGKTGLEGWIARHSDKLLCEATEWILWDLDLMVAGTLDAVCYSRKTNLRHILDWKTNKKFTIENRYGDKLLPPFADLDDCHLTRYSLQLSIYRLLLKRATKWATGDGWLVHVGQDGVVTTHRALDLRDRLSVWLPTLPTQV
jgi:ATP-dependent exoDNAse (exonuclease V) beta subunit